AIRRTVAFPGISMDRLQSMLGAYNGHLKQIEQRLDVKVSHRGDSFFIDGEIDAVERAELLLQRLHEESEQSGQISADTLHLMIQGSQTDRELQDDLHDQEHTGLDNVWLQTRKGRINPRGANQKRYVQRILQSDISFGIGPAGTGKTYLAV
ncbi:phosphate starvation-inducible protein, partial [Kingella kingae PYKK081]